MAGRTHGQPGSPVTFGWKAASWADEVRRHLDRLREGAPRWLVGQLGGGTGSLVFYGDRGLAVRARFCAELGLADPGISWLTARDRGAEFAQLLALICGTLARIGGEVYELQRPEIGELAEAAPAGTVGSITMPHKHNPEVERASGHAGQAGPGERGRDDRSAGPAARAGRPRLEGRMGGAAGGLPAGRRRPADRPRPAGGPERGRRGDAPQPDPARRVPGQRTGPGPADAAAGRAPGAGAAAGGPRRRPGRPDRRAGAGERRAVRPGRGAGTDRATGHRLVPGHGRPGGRAGPGRPGGRAGRNGRDRDGPGHAGPACGAAHAADPRAAPGPGRGRRRAVRQARRSHRVRVRRQQGPSAGVPAGGRARRGCRHARHRRRAGLELLRRGRRRPRRGPGCAASS